MAETRTAVPDVDDCDEPQEHKARPEAYPAMCSYCMVERIVEGFAAAGFEADWGDGTESGDPVDGIIAMLRSGLNRVVDGQLRINDRGQLESAPPEDHG